MTFQPKLVLSLLFMTIWIPHWHIHATAESPFNPTISRQVDDSNFPSFSNQRFRIIEESPNGTEVIGVAEYLNSQVVMRYRSDTSRSERQTTYQLLDSHDMLTRLLRIQPQTGSLLIEGRVDREALCVRPPSPAQTVGFLSATAAQSTTCLKRVSVLATVAFENQKTDVEMVTIPLELVIEDINDNRPSWEVVGSQTSPASSQPPNYPVLDASIMEQTSDTDFGPSRSGAETSRILISAANDPDDGLNGEIEYELRNFNSPEMQSGLGEINEEIGVHPDAPISFKISGPVNGMLQLTPLHAIDYEKTSIYNFLLIARDKGRPQQTGYAHLKIHVIDVNDETPVFTQDIYLPASGAVSERTPPGTILLNVTATDGDASEANSHLRYSLVPSNNLLVPKFFSVHPDGRILLRHWLDYETLEPMHMYSSPSALRTAPPSKGKQFSFYVQAVDAAPAPYERTGTALVVIPIQDENDEAPIISSRFLGPPDLVRHGEAGVITENSSVPVRLAYIQARDPDFDGRDRVDCTVLDNSNLSLRRLTPTDDHKPPLGASEGYPVNNDFLLSLEAPVDRETTQMLVARIHCTDEAKNPSDKLIRIRVLDINDEAPTFLWPIFYFSVKENRKLNSGGRGAENSTNKSPQGYRIGRVIAYDRDQGDNANIIYRLLPQLEISQPVGRPSFLPQPDSPRDLFMHKATDLFQVDSFTGEVFALRPFDAEQIDMIKFQVIAVDQPTAPDSISHTGTASIHVRIVDVNDWSPIFFKTNDKESTAHGYNIDDNDGITLVDSYIFSVPENKPAYTIVGRIGVLDPDVSFWVNANTTLEGSGSKNPHLPRISLRFASDTLAHIKDALSIHTTTGQIRTVHPLDRETYANYSFSVVAIDKGSEDRLSRTSTVAVTVIVEDENDNDPVFVRPRPVSGTSSQQIERSSDSSTARETSNTPKQGEAVVRDDTESFSVDSQGPTPPAKDQILVVAVQRASMPMTGDSGEAHLQSGDSNGRPLIRVEAHDPDAGPNGEIRYSIASGNVDDIFYLDASSGSLFLKSPGLLKRPPLPMKSSVINTEAEFSYLLRLEACDMGTPKRCATPAWLRMVMDYPSPAMGGMGFQKVWSDPQDSGQPYTQSGSNPFLDSNMQPLSGRDRSNYPSRAVGQWPPYMERWGQLNSRLKQNEYMKDWRLHNRGLSNGKVGDFIVDERHYDSRRSVVSASEAVIICLAVIFAVLLCAALALVYLVKRRSIYFSVAGRQKNKSTEAAPSPEYVRSNFKNEASTTCEGLDPSDKASLYRMVADTRAPGKIVFVDNNFDRQSLPEGATSDEFALSPVAKGKRLSVQEHSLRRGLSASAAVLTNMESIYISPGAESVMGASDYPELVSRSTITFKHPHVASYHREAPNIQNFVTPDTGPAVMFGTVMGPNSTAQTVRYGPAAATTASSGYASPPQRAMGDYVATDVATDVATFQRRCASLKPRPYINANPYRYIQPPGAYVYGSVISNPTRGEMQHFRGLSEPTPANNQVAYSPHGAFFCPTEDAHTYHDLDIFAATLQRQRRFGYPLEQVAEVVPTNCQPSSPYGQLQQLPLVPQPVSGSRYATLTTRMAPGGEVQSRRASMSLKRPLAQRESIQQQQKQQKREASQQASVTELDCSASGQTTNFNVDGETTRSLNSLTDAYMDAEVLDSTTDPKAKLLNSTDESFPNDRTLTPRRPRSDGVAGGPTSPEEGGMPVVSTNEVASSFNTLKAFTSKNPQNSTYAVHAYHEASFV